VPYPNFEGKHAHQALVEPAAFLQYWVDTGALPADRRAPRGVVVLYAKPLFDILVAQPGVTSFGPPEMRPTAFLDLHTFDDTDGTVGVIGGFGIGAPAATSIVESLRAIGVQQFVSMGAAGGLQPGLQPGDVIVCDRAVRDEGVSHHYLPSALWAEPSPGLTARLHDRLEVADLAPKPGSAWTIDAPFRETVAEAEHYATQGVAVVEMEAAALFAVAEVRDIEVAAAFAISDSLADGEWVPHFADQRLADSLLRMVPAAIDTLREPG
jgi:uridine phosphorylase